MKLIFRTIYALFMAVDLFTSALTFGAPLQTLSARFGKARRAGSRVGTAFADATDFVARHVFWSHAHCDAAIAAYEARVAAAPSWSG